MKYFEFLYVAILLLTSYLDAVLWSSCMNFHLITVCQEIFNLLDLMCILVN